jgi:anti-sigma factor RsiW
MSNNLDDELRSALRSVDPGEEFAARVMARIANESTRPRRSVPAGYQWLSAALVAAVVFGVLIAHDRQLIEALRVTGEKLDLAYRVVNDEAHAATRENSGA